MQETTFLGHFEPPRRSLIANMFCTAVRQGHRTVSTVLVAVTLDVQRRLADTWTEAPVRTSLEILRAQLPTEAAEEYADYILRWEALTPEEKQRIKQQRSAAHQKQWMDQQPPTTAQIDYLQNLGYRGAAPATKLAASQLIGQLLERKAA